MNTIAYTDKYPRSIWKAFTLLVYITLIKAIIEIGVNIIAAAYVGIYTGISGGDFDLIINGSLNTINLTAVAVSDFILISVLLYLTRKRRIQAIPFKETFKVRPSLKVAVCGVLGVFFISLLGGLVTQSFSGIFQAEIPEQIEAMMQVEAVLNFETLMTLITVVIAAPLFEEFLLRKIMMDGLLRRYDAKIVIVISALFFAVFHMNIVQGAYTFILGLYLAYLYYKTGSLWLVTLIHATNNLYAVLVRVIPESIANIGATGLMFAGLVSLIILYLDLKNSSIQWIDRPDLNEEADEALADEDLASEVVTEEN